MITSTDNAEYYTWGTYCDGWHLLKTPSLSVIQERMPPGTTEQRHYHQHAQQLFYILSGTALFEAADKQETAVQGQSYHIPPGVSHRITNKSDEDLHFLVISEPRSHGDRINV